MTIIAQGSKIPWESIQARKPEQVEFLQDNIIVFRLVRGQMYKEETQRAELRVKKPYPNGSATDLSLSYFFTLLTDVNFKGELVISQLPWDGGSPDNSIRIDTQTKRMYYLNYNVKGNPKRVQEITLVPQVKVGQEYEIVYRMNGQSNSSGWVEIYIDGEKKERKGQNLYPPTDKDSYPKIGAYLGNDDLPAGVNEVKVRFRDIKFGTSKTTYEEHTGRTAGEPEKPKEEEQPETPNDPGVPNEPVKETPDITEDLAEIDYMLIGIHEKIAGIRNKVKR